MNLFKKKECVEHHWEQVQGGYNKKKKAFEQFIWKCKNCGKILKEDEHATG